MTEITTIREVAEAQAEAVLSLRLFIPGVIEGGADRHYLARTRPRRPPPVVQSVTRNPDGRIATVSISTEAGETILGATASHASGRTADGRGIGRSKYVFVSGLSADEVEVRVQMSWTTPDGTRGRTSGELVVPWLGAARAELADGGWMAAEITPFEPPPAPAAS